MEAFNGTWKRRGMVHIPVIEPNPVGRPARPVMVDWDHASLLRAHADFVAGVRSMVVVEGERVYQRGRKRLQRSRMSKTDREWCERTAVAESWKPVYYR